MSASQARRVADLVARLDNLRAQGWGMAGAWGALNDALRDVAPTALDAVEDAVRRREGDDG